MTVYPVTSRPPLSAGAVHDTVTCRSPTVACTSVGTPGTDAGTNTADSTLDGPSPTLFDAYTRNLYPTPFTNPSTVHDVPSTTHDNPPGIAVTVYPLMTFPPSSTGAAHDTVTTPLPTTPTTSVGAPGTIAVSYRTTAKSLFEPLSLNPASTTLWSF